MAEVSGWLPNLLGPHALTEDGGDPVTARPTWNVVGMTLADDPANERTTITVDVTDVSGVLPIANGGSGHAGAAAAVSAFAIDWTLSNVFTKTLAAGANTFTFSNAASGMCIIVRVTGAASTLTWPTVKWAGGTPPTQTASGKDVYTFFHDGTDIYGSAVQDCS